MPVVPETKATWTTSVDALSSTNLHAYLRDPLKFLMGKPVAELRATVGQSLASGAFVPLLFQVEDVDADPDAVGGHSTSVNTSRYTCRYPGWYRIGGSVTHGGSATGRRGCRWARNGAPIPASAVLLPGASGVSSIAADMLVRLDEGDYLELQAFQDSGGSLTTLSSSDNQARMTVVWERLI